MSTKLHHGWRLRLGGGPTAVPRFVSKARAALLPTYQNLWQRAAVAGAVSVVDANRLGLPIEWLPDQKFGSPLFEMGQWLDRQHTGDRTQRRIDFGFEAVFLADPANEQWVYALVYTDQEPYREVWQRLPGVSSYPYWDNTDPPDDVTDHEWRQRRDVWDRVVGWDAPAVRGVTWTLLGDQLDTCGWAGIVDRWSQFVPDVTARRQTLAQMTAGQQLLATPSLSTLPLTEFLQHRRGLVAEALRDLETTSLPAVTWPDLTGDAAGFIARLSDVPFS